MSQTCFVVMGFGEKTDYKTSRVPDLNKTCSHIVVRSYRHDGKALDIDVVEVSRDKLTQAIKDIKDIMAGGRVDSPVYTFLPLTAPHRAEPSRKSAGQRATAAATVADGAPPVSLAALMDGAQEARPNETSSPRNRCSMRRARSPRTTASLPDEAQALEQARSILRELPPCTRTTPRRWGCGEDSPLNWVEVGRPGHDTS